jgi:hypothetical protein
MKQSASFSGKEIENTSLNFSELREKGLEYIQKLSGDVWTDYNSHDPGVTILEQICYALTDLAFRTSLPVEDLLTTGKGIPVDPNIHAFFTPSSILSSHPVTVDDARKMIIDQFHEIQNVWITTNESEGFAEQMNGINHIEILPKLNFLDSFKSDPILKEKFIDKVNQFLYENRNIGERYESAHLLEPQEINITFDVYINEHEDVESIIAKLFLKLMEFIYSPVQYSSYNEMKEAGNSLEESFFGPRLNNGFIKNEALKPRLKSIHSNEIQKLLTKVPGISKCEVKPFNLNGVESKTIYTEKGKFLHLLIEDTTNDNVDNRFDNIYKNMTVFLNNKKLSVLNKQKINTLFSETWSKKHRGYRIGKSLDELFYSKLNHTFRNPGEYFSLQRHFPLIYGIGEEGVSQNDPVERQAKALQLKAYLMLFEQHLANHLAQLGSLNEFFNIDLKSNDGKVKTYFAQWIKSIPDVDKLSSENVEAIESWLEQQQLAFDRKNRIYNHLLARFGEDLNDLPWKVALRLNMIQDEDELSKILLQKKSDFLMQLKKLSYFRTKGEAILSVHSKGSEQTLYRNPSGLEQMILAKTGIPSRNEQFLVPDFIDFKVQKQVAKEEPIKGYEELNLNFRPLRAEEIVKQNRSNQVLHMPNAMFGKISLKALYKETLNYNNYRLSVPKSATDRVRVIFQKEKNTWVNLCECMNEAEAIEKIRQLISYFINLNFQSEGIYFIDHILLSDFLKDSKFGFCFYDEYGSALFHTSESDFWYHSAEDRNKFLQKFYRFGLQRNSYAYENGKWVVKDDLGNVLAVFSNKPENNQISFEALYRQTKSIIQLFNCSGKVDGRLRFEEMEKIRKKGSFHDQSNHYGQRRLVYQRRLPNGDIIDEDFFNLNISVLIPDWPARFQIERFKDYVTDLIHERIPAHIGNDILWLNAHEMKAFEEKYRLWEKLKSEAKITKSHTQKVKSSAYKVYQLLVELKRNK